MYQCFTFSGYTVKGIIVTIEYTIKWNLNYGNNSGQDIEQFTNLGEKQISVFLCLLTKEPKLRDDETMRIFIVKIIMPFYNQ